MVRKCYMHDGTWRLGSQVRTRVMASHGLVYIIQGRKLCKKVGGMPHGVHALITSQDFDVCMSCNLVGFGVTSLLSRWLRLEE